MANIISQLLEAEEPLFSIAIKRLEDSIGKPGQDVRLIGDIIQKRQKTLKSLGLDTRDTTGKELYQALIHKVKVHDEHLVKHIGGKDSGDTVKLMPLMKRAIEKSDAPMKVWVVKKSVAKRMLHDCPPQKIMKHLGYTSVESMTKRESLAEIFGALRFAESDAWLRKFNNKYKHLQPSDFETRDIEIVVMPKERWGDMAEKFIKTNKHSITHLKELGIVLMLPVKLDYLPGVTITTLPLALHYLNEIRLYSAFFKLQQVKPNFGKIVSDTLNSDVDSAAVVAGNNVHWRIIQRHYGKLDNDSHPEIFEPHLQPEDLHWRKAEQQLFRIDPELKFWDDLDYVGVIAEDGLPVSFNLLDMAMSYCTNASFQQRMYLNMRKSLWNELFVRYLGNRVLEQQVLQQLDGSTAVAKLRI